MSLKKLGPAKWRVTASVRDKRKGYPVSKQITVEGSRSEAVLAEAGLLAKLRAQTSSLKTIDVATFGDAVTLYCDKLRATGRQSKSHLFLVEFLRRELGHVPIEELPDRFEAYLRVMMATPTKQGRSHTGGMVNRCITIVKAVFNRLVDLEVVDRNPITKVRFAQTKAVARNRFLSPEEQLRLFAAIRAYRPELMPLIAYMMVVPCRVSELTTARREQYSPISNTIYIPDSKAGIPIYKPVPAEMVDYFKSIPDGCPWLFYWVDGRGEYRPWHVFQHTWRTVLRNAGIVDLHVHDLRHISATDLLEAGNTNRAIMLIAGWKTDMLSVYYNKDSLTAAHKIRFCDESLQSRYNLCNSM